MNEKSRSEIATFIYKIPERWETKYRFPRITDVRPCVEELSAAEYALAEATGRERILRDELTAATRQNGHALEQLEQCKANAIQLLEENKDLKQVVEGDYQQCLTVNAQLQTTINQLEAKCNQVGQYLLTAIQQRDKASANYIRSDEAAFQLEARNKELVAALERANKILKAWADNDVV